MLTVSVAELRTRGWKLLRRLRNYLPSGFSLQLTDGVSQPGGGSCPLLSIPTILLFLSCDGLSPRKMEDRLRNAPVPVIGRISGGRFLLDLRTVLEEDEPHLVAMLRTLGTLQ